MKNIIISSLLCLCVLISCKKDSNLKSSLSNNKLDQLSQATKDMLALNSYAGMKQAYSLLSVEEKQQLWLAKFEIIAENNNDALSSEQLKLVNTFRDALVMHGMKRLKENPKIGETIVALNKYILERNFTKEQQLLLFEHPFVTNDFSLLKSESYLSTLVSNSQKTLIGQTSSLFGQSDCTCRYTISCWGSGNMCEEKKDNCREIWECGFLGNSSCTGRCTLDGPGESL